MQSCLASSLFPVGHLTKEEVKQIATEAGFEHIARQKEVGERERELFVFLFVLFLFVVYAGLFTGRVWDYVSLGREILPSSSVR